MKVIGAPGRGGVQEGGVVAHEAEVVVVELDLAQRGRTDCPVLDRHLVRAPGAVVGDRERVGHGAISFGR